MVKQAIIPLAGLGTRLLPLSSVIPKELLPINGKPNLEYIMDECIQAGIKQFILVVPKNRPSIKKYFLILGLFFGTMKINCFIPASIHSSMIYSKFGLPLIGNNSFGITLDSGNNLVPNPANGMIACLIIKTFY